MKIDYALAETLSEASTVLYSLVFAVESAEGLELLIRARRAVEAELSLHLHGVPHSMGVCASGGTGAFTRTATAPCLAATTFV